jgi:hypothetical protein
MNAGGLCRGIAGRRRDDVAASYNAADALRPRPPAALGRWILTLFASLLAALPFLRRRRGGRPGDPPAAPRKPFLPPGESAKLAPIWDGFGDRVAALFGDPEETGDDAPVTAAEIERSTRGASDSRRHGSPFVWWSAATPWLLAAAGGGAFFLPAGEASRRFLLLGAVSGLVGFWTNWLAIRLLFKPTKPRFGFGVIPANRSALIERLSEAIESRLVNPEALAEWLREKGLVRKTLERWHDAASRVLGSSAFRDDLKARLGATGALYLEDDKFRAAATEKLSGAVRDVLRQKVWKWVADLVEAPVLERVKTELLKGLRANGGEMLGGALAKLDLVLDELAARLAAALPEIEEAASERIVAGLRSLDVRGLVAAKLREMDDGELERLIRDAVRNELAAVEVLGGVLGVFAGLLTPFLL